METSASLIEASPRAIGRPVKAEANPPPRLSASLWTVVRNCDPFDFAYIILVGPRWRYERFLDPCYRMAAKGIELAAFIALLVRAS